MKTKMLGIGMAGLLLAGVNLFSGTVASTNLIDYVKIGETKTMPTALLEVRSTNQVVMTVECPYWNWNTYPAPTNASDVVIKLTTADGKKWKCKWEEVK